MRRIFLAALVLVIPLLPACSWQSTHVPPPALHDAAIASAHPLATQAGVQILQQGGNAFDAAVAVTAALAVVEPYSSGIGGGGFWLLHKARDNTQIMIDGREKRRWPRTATCIWTLTAKSFRALRWMARYPPAFPACRRRWRILQNNTAPCR